MEGNAYRHAISADLDVLMLLVDWKSEKHGNLDFLYSNILQHTPSIVIKDAAMYII